MQYAINALLDKQHSKQAKPHHMATSQLTPKQNQKIKSSIIDINHHLNQVLPAFGNLNKELSPGFHLVDISQMVTYYLWWVLWYFKEFKNAKLDKWQKMLLSLRSNPQTMSP